ncbi:acyltransferase family protein [Hyphomicrobium sp.]|uniref:acyltransferase family protein n=1 Tax=Hyphomicrobium sp. TaxID=82 RepID=UPI0025C3FAA7|nr:acyltransferase family protein [Hyphomicrobium sp.]MCC7252696.1 acyltransferase [Hyphomicrobium sp.]
MSIRDRSRHGVDFRADIEGLRGVSVAAVVAYHAVPSLLPGGFVGVDVFFVISGFLITGILLSELNASGRIDLIAFWGRRIRRILPAATLVLCATCILISLLPSIDTRAVGKSVIAAALFYLNFRQAGEAVNYLADDDADNPVLHYWSLAVEEQFYLLWPLLLVGLFLLAARLRQGRLVPPLAAFIIVLLAASFSYGAWLTFTDAPYAFFSTFSRAWQFLAGALAALLIVDMRGGESETLASAASLACVMVLAASFMLIDTTTPYPGFAALAPTAAAALLIYLNSGGRTLGALAMAVPPLRYLGRISFSLYLWHWPLLVIGKAKSGDSPTVTLAAVLLSVALAAVTYAWVEQPVRTSPRLVGSKRHVLALGLGLVLIGSGFGLVLRKFGPDSVAIGPGVYASAQAITSDRPIIYEDDCLVRIKAVAYGTCAYAAVDGDRTVVLFGDSHAANWYPPLYKASAEEGWRLVVRVKASCVPADVVQYRDAKTVYRECEQWQKTVLSELQDMKPDVIVVAGITHEHPLESEKRMFETLAAASGALIVMRDTPHLPEAPVKCLRRTGNPSACVWSVDQLRGRGYPKLAEAELPRNARVLDVNDRVCPDGVCHAVTNGIVTMTDNHHLTATFSTSFADAFAEILKAYRN